MFRRFRLVFAVIPLVTGLLQPLPAYAGSPVTIDCGDGAPISGTVDLNTLTELEGSIQAMIDNPSGMSCSLSQPTALDPLASSNDPGSFVVGGGRYFSPGTPCAINFGISGHVDQTGIAHGTQTATINNNDPQECGGVGHAKANVTCVAVSGNLAEIRGVISQQTGSLGPQFFPPGDTVLVTDVQDNGNPNTGIPDQILQFVDATGTENACVAGITFPPPFDVTHGNITVHDG